jgi:hypothetical protein
MTTPRRKDGGPSRSLGISSRTRGAIVVGLAVIVGLVGLQIVSDSGPGSGSSIATATTGTFVTAPTVTSPGGTTSTARATPGAGPASTTRARRPNNQVKVKVYNASGAQGRAQILTNHLHALGYNAQTPANVSPQRKGTVVECETGFETEGTLLALYGVGGGATIRPYPSNPPAGASQANCLVILGT